MAEPISFADFGEPPSLGVPAVQPFRPMDLETLFAQELPEPEAVIEGLVSAGDAVLFSGREKSGKGLIAIDVCASVACGEPFLGRGVMEGPAIYCAAEESLRDVRARIETRLGARRDVPLAVLPLNGYTGDRLRLEDPLSVARLDAMVQAVEPVLVVIDVLREVHGGKEDSSDEMAPLLRPLRELAHTTNTAVLVTHHQNKSGGFRGSTAIRAAFDSEIALTRTDEASEGVLRGTLRAEGRSVPPQLIPIRFGDGGRWEATDTLPFLLDTTLRGRILHLLAERQEWLNATEIADALGVKRKTVQNELARMVAETPCPLAISGQPRKGHPRRFHALEQPLVTVPEEGTTRERIVL